MAPEIESGPIGTIGAQSVKFEHGKLIAEAHVEVSFGKVGVSLEMNADPVVDMVLDAIEKAIPGEIDNAIIEKARPAIKAYLAAL